MVSTSVKYPSHLPAHIMFFSDHNKRNLYKLLLGLLILLIPVIIPVISSLTMVLFVFLFSILIYFEFLFNWICMRIDEARSYCLGATGLSRKKQKTVQLSVDD